MRILLAALALLATPAAAQQLTPAETAQVDKVVTEALTASGVPSASIAVVRDGQLVLAKAYGKASETIPQARPELPYQIASISKQFVATALQLLENDGKLTLDDKVSEYLPEVSGAGAMTIRQLVDHTSGLRDYWPQDFSFPDMAKPVTPQGIVDKWAKLPLDFPSGSQWQYSNTGYVVAGLIVEKVAGEPLLAFLQRRIFRPLGMTSVVSQDAAIGPAFPQGYKRHALGPVRVETPAAPGWLYAAGELSMTASDLAKWNIARIERKLLPAEDWQAQETPTRLSDGTNTNYGLGVTVGAVEGRRVVSHSGESVGFLSDNIVFTQDRAAVTVLTNSWFGGAVGTILRGVIRAVLPPPPPVGPEAAWVSKARALYDQLRGGTLDRKQLTDNANYYFTPATLADVQTSLAPLGEPTGFTVAAPGRARGGFVYRRFFVTYPDKTLVINSFAEPGADGRFEQFIIGLAQ